MRILVIGSVPPPFGGHRESLLAQVLRLREEAHDVEIISLNRLAAAHRYLAGPGLVAVAEIGGLARSADAVIVQIEPGLPVRSSAGRCERVAALMSLAAVLRRCPDVTLRLHRREDLPEGLGGRAATALWKAAGRIEVGDETMHLELAGLLGPLGGRVSTAVAVPTDIELPADPSPGGWGDAADATASHVLAIVRARAAVERVSLARRERSGASDSGLDARVPQWQWLPAPGAGVPDLGPLLATQAAGHDRQRGAPASSESVARALRRAATSVMDAADRRPATRPLADVARLGLIELRSLLRKTG